MEYRCTEVKSRKDIRDFLGLPAAIYDRALYPRQKGLERQILTGRHPLSRDFEIVACLVRGYGQGGGQRVLARCILTFYKEDDTAYAGFFESHEDVQAVRLLFSYLADRAREKGRTSLTGPVDCSFWIRYRFKTDHFAQTYTGEPYNPPYYVRLWEAAGFTVKERYYSNYLRTPGQGDAGIKCKDRLRYSREKGYEIRYTDRRHFRQDLDAIYGLLTEVYCGFPVYKPLSRRQFRKMFGKLRWVLNFEMVFLAYHGKRLAGFLICLPNFSSSKESRCLFGKAEEYVILYMGAGRRDAGLGGALSELCREYLEKNSLRGIAALIHEGNFSGNFYKSLTTRSCHYVLLERQV